MTPDRSTPTPPRTEVRPSLLPLMTKRLRELPVDPRGYPVPFFVAKVNGQWDFRVVDPAKIELCVRQKLCWICGDKMHGMVSFVAGPMCALNRVSSEPPMHVSCACFTVRACPFILNPMATRRVANEPPKAPPPGIMIERNPGVSMIWSCLHFRREPNKLFVMGPPATVGWFREGRFATRAEVMASIDSGIPILRSMCRSPEEEDAVTKRYDWLVKRWVPRLS